MNAVTQRPAEGHAREINTCGAWRGKGDCTVLTAHSSLAPTRAGSLFVIRSLAKTECRTGFD